MNQHFSRSRARFAGLPCTTINEACDSFRQSLVAQCVNGGERRVDLSNLGGADSDGIPRSVAFLAGMVFAAYEMRDDENADDSTYFYRLRELLGVNAAPKGVRPRGMVIPIGRPAPEESLCASASSVGRKPIPACNR
jgi:hypothetical protein